MKAFPAALLCLGALASACGGDDRGQVGDDMPPVDGPLLDRLNALPGVNAEGRPSSTPGYTNYKLWFTQPVDHDDPDGPTFVQHVSLMHRNEAAPMVVFTTGYNDYWGWNPTEQMYMLSANQISIEHRFFGDSRPQPSDWTKLTIEQMARDQHAIVTALKTIYTGAYVATGASKGGMTATYFRRFFPDDVDATVPYVAPISFAAGDDRYVTFFDTVGTAPCREKVRAIAVEMLQNRRAMLVARATAQGDSYTRLELGAAVESAVTGLEFSFWSYFGVTACPAVPATRGTDDEVWDFLDRVSPPSGSNDAAVAQFEAYYYQAMYQLGYPASATDYLTPYLAYGDEAYANLYPQPLPTYDGGAAMNDIDAWVQSEGERLLFVYGEGDPWTAGAYRLGNATDSYKFIVEDGTHNAGILDLPDADKATAKARLSEWMGVAASGKVSTTRAARIASPRIPPAVRVALERMHARPSADILAP